MSLALDGEIGRRELLRLRAHLLRCRACLAHRRSLYTVSSTLRASAPELALPALARAGSAVRVPRRAFALAAATAAALIVFAGLAGEHRRPVARGALSAAQGMPVYGGLQPDQGYPIYAYSELVLPPV